MAGQRSRSCGLWVTSLQLLTFILWGTLRVKCQGQQVVPVTCPDGWETLDIPGYMGVCVLASTSRLTMRNANLLCDGQGAMLGIPPSDRYTQWILQDAQMRGWDDMWINARGGNRIWNWDFGGRRLQLQGCWTDDPGYRDLEMQVKPQNKSVESCTEECQSRGYPRASVQITQNGDFMCRCGKSFGNYQRVNLMNCQSLCPEAPSGSPFRNLCGGDGLQTVFIVDRQGPPSASMDTLLSHAALELPYWNTRSVGECAAIVGGSSIRWNQTNCHNRKPYICQYTSETCQITSTEGHTWLGGTCVTFHRDTLTWFEARATCLNMGGMLLSLDVPYDKFLTTAIAAQLERFSWWIGLSIYTWTQTDGMALPPYNGWRPGEPLYNNSMPNVCVHARREDLFRWSTTACHGMKNFYCIKSPALTPFTVLPTTRPPIPDIGSGITPITLLPPMTRPPVTFIDMTTTVVAESTPSPTGNPQPQGGLTPIFIGAIGAGVGVGFVLIVIGIWCCCRRCTSSSKDSSKDTDDNGKPRRLPSIPGGGRGVHRINGKTVRYLSEPTLSLNHLPPEDNEDDGEYDYIDIALKKDGAGEEDGVKYQGLTDSMKKKKAVEILEMEYEDLRPNSGLPEDNYIIPMEPPKSVNGVLPRVLKATNEKAPLGMTMPGKVGKTVEASLKVRDSSRDSKPDAVTDLKPTADTKSEEAVSTMSGKESRAEEMENAGAKPDTGESEYADMSAAEDSDDEDMSLQTPDDYEVIPDEAKVDTKSEVDNEPDGETPSESVIEMEKAT